MLPLATGSVAIPVPNPAKLTSPVDGAYRDSW